MSKLPAWLPTGKLSRDVAWNLASLGIIGLSGLMLNLLVGRFYGPAVLGAFNQVLALYIVFSQFAMWGVYYSTVKHVAQYHEHPRRCAAISLAALVVTALAALLFTVLFWLARLPAGRWLDSPAVVVGMAWAAPGLGLFALNKVLLAILQGHRQMRRFALFNASRYALLVAFLGLALIWEWPGERLPAVFTLTEALLMILMAPVVWPHLRPPYPGWRRWLAPHVLFGGKSLASGVLLELNTRVDVLMLGLFLSDAVVGIYSLAAMVAEGLFQVLVVLRFNFDPLLTQLATGGGREELAAFLKRARLAGYALWLAAALPAALLFRPVVEMLLGGSAFLAGWPSFLILLGFIFLAAGYIPLRNLVMQAGYPGYQSLMIAIMVAVNVVGNLLFIPWLGMEGAALGTGLSFLSVVPLVKIFSRRLVGVLP